MSLFYEVIGLFALNHVVLGCVSFAGSRRGLVPLGALLLFVDIAG